MKSKEEILKRNVESIAKCNVKYNVTQQGILNAMEEYAIKCQEDMADKWISVNDNKPTQNQYVLIYGKGDRQMTAIYQDNDFCCYDIMTEGLEIAEEITHWMILPNKPISKTED